MLVSLRAAAASPDRRGTARRHLRLATTLSEEPGQSITVHDLSSVGILIETSAKLRLQDDFELDLPEAHWTHAKVVWSSGRFFGCEFTRPISRAALSATRLRSQVLPQSSDGGNADRTIVSGSPSPKANQSGDLPLGTKFSILVALALDSWALVALLVAGARAMIG